MGIIQRQGLKNTISSYVGILLGFLSLLVIQPLFLKPEEIGLARVLFACSTLISTIIPLGVTNLTIKYFPYFRKPDKGHYGFLGFMLLFPLVGFLICGGVLYFFQEFFIAQFRRESQLFIHYYNYIYLFSFLLGFISVITNYLLSIFKTTVPSYLNDIFVRLGYMLLVIVYYYGYLSLDGFIACYVGIYAVQLLVMLFYLFKVDTPSLKIDWSHFGKIGVKDMVSFGLVLSLTSMAAIGLKMVDSIMIGKELGLFFVGIYTVTSFIPTLIDNPLNALDKIATPKIAHALAENDLEDVRDVYYKSVKYLFLLGGFLFVMINTNIAYLLAFLKPEYMQGVVVVYIISFGTLVNMLGGVNTSILFYSSKQWQGALLLLMLVIITFVLNKLLIPIYGLKGAAFATALSAVLYTLLKYVIIWRKFRFQPINANVGKVVLIISACFGINLLLPELDNNILNILLRGAILSLVYIISTYFLKLVPELYVYLPSRRK